MSYFEGYDKGSVCVMGVAHRALPSFSAVIAVGNALSGMSLLALPAAAMLSFSMHAWYISHSVSNSREDRDVDMYMEIVAFHNFINLVGMILLFVFSLFSGTMWALGVSGLAAVIAYFAVDSSNKVSKKVSKG